MRIEPNATATERPPLAQTELGAVLELVLRAGQLLLESGANTARVEETMHRLGTALGAAWVDAFVTPSAIVVSLHGAGEHQTRLQRIVATGVNLDRIAAITALSRDAAAGRADRSAVRDGLERIAHAPRMYGHWLTLVSVALACGCFAALQGAPTTTMAVTCVAAACAFQARAWLHRLRVERFLLTGSVAVVGASIALALTQLVAAPAPAAALLSSVLLLLPGALMVSSINDLFRGDTTAGIARLVGAGLHIIAIGAGLWGVLLASGVDLGTTGAVGPPLLAALGLSALASAGFGIAFNVPRPALLWAAVNGLGANGVRLALVAAGFPAEAAIFAGGVVVALVPELLARRLKLPTSVFTLPGFIPMIPGTLAFRAVLAMVDGAYPAALAGLAQVAVLTFALAAGMGTVVTLGRGRAPRVFA